MNDILLICLVAFLCLIHVVFVARRRPSLATAVAFTIFVSVFFILASHLLSDGRISRPDEARYLYEIENIGLNPADWNPITGVGPSYDVTPKMGYSYVVGLLQYVFRTEPRLTALAFNVLAGMWLSIAVYHLSFLLSGSTRASVLAAFLSALYPEILFWKATVLRENLSLLLVTILIYVVLRLNLTLRLKYVFVIIGVTFALSLVRAQLALFSVVLVVLSLPFYYLRLWKRIESRSGIAGLFTLLVLGLGLLVGWSHLETQIIRASGYATIGNLPLVPQILYETVIDRSIWTNVMAVLSPVARGGQEFTGFLLALFVVPTWGLVLFSLTRFRKIFGEQTRNAMFVLAIILVFILSLAIYEASNIRFRATIAPALIAYLGPVVWYLRGCLIWKKKGIPQRRSPIHTAHL